MLKCNSLNRQWLSHILQRKISFSCNPEVHRFCLREREEFLLSPNRTCLERRQLNLKPWCWASAVQWRNWTESLASPGWPCTAEPPPPDLDPPQLPVLCCPSEEGKREERGFFFFLQVNAWIQCCISRITSYVLVPPFYSAEMCDICSDGESDRDCIFDKSLSTASGPGKQREMGLQVKKESSEISRQMYYWNTMTPKSIWTLKGTVHQRISFFKISLLHYIIKHNFCLYCLKECWFIILSYKAIRGSKLNVSSWYNLKSVLLPSNTIFADISKHVFRGLRSI